MKFAVSSYSFQQYLRDGRMTQLDCVLKAKEMGFDAIEFTDLQPPEGVGEEEYAQQIAQECKKVGLTVSNYTVFADFLANDPKTEAQRLMKRWMLHRSLEAPVCDMMPHGALVQIEQTEVCKMWWSA